MDFEWFLKFYGEFKWIQWTFHHWLSRCQEMHSWSVALWGFSAAFKTQQMVCPGARILGMSGPPRGIPKVENQTIRVVPYTMYVMHVRIDRYAWHICILYIYIYILYIYNMYIHTHTMYAIGSWFLPCKMHSCCFFWLGPGVISRGAGPGSSNLVEVWIWFADIVMFRFRFIYIVILSYISSVGLSFQSECRDMEHTQWW